VFIHPDKEMNVVPQQAMVTSYGVGADFLEGVTLMRVSGGVIDCAGEIVLGQLLISGLIVLAAPATTAAPSASPLSRAVALAGSSAGLIPGYLDLA
jgi:hypothetical protein